MRTEPPIGKFPTEVFGQVYSNISEDGHKTIENQHCPYICTECKKPRKSEPTIKVGVCSLGYKGGFINKHIPVIVCPHRLSTSEVFHTLNKEFFLNWKNVNYTKEVGMGVGGNVDFVAYEKNGIKITDFSCIEFQAAGTTGTPWPAIQDLKIHKKYRKKSYNYGINWANEFVKTMMQQVYKKGKIATLWKKNIIFIVQDVAIDYIRSSCDSSGLRDYDPNSYIHFCTFSMHWENNCWKLIFKEKISSDIQGINKILSGAHEDDYISIDAFIDNINKKSAKDNKS